MDHSRCLTGLDRGNAVRIPVDLLKAFNPESEIEVFITSTDGKTVTIHALKAWIKFSDELADAGKKNPLVRRFLLEANAYGQIARIDDKGRIVIPPLLRRKIKLEGPLTLRLKDGHLELGCGGPGPARPESRKNRDKSE